MNKGIVIQCQLTSDENKIDEILYENIDNKSVLETTIENLDKLEEYEIILLVSKGNIGLSKREEIKNSRVKVLVKEEVTLIQAYNKIIQEFNLDLIIRVIGNNCLVDTELIKNSVKSHLENNAQYSSFMNFPMGLTPTEIISAKIFKNTHLLTKQNNLDVNIFSSFKYSDDVIKNQICASEDYKNYGHANLSFTEYNKTIVKKIITNKLNWKNEFNTINLEDNNQYKWRCGKNSEVSFWYRFFESENVKDIKERKYYSRLDEKFKLQDYVEDSINKECGEEVSILDVGAGPLSILGKKSEKCKLKITAVDPLANEYEEILNKFNIKPIVKTKYAEVEKLNQVFQPGTFDVTHMSNALDHSYNPLEGIKQMLYVTKNGGKVILFHHLNEAQTENYEGFHQWNFCVEDDRFVIWNKTEKHIIDELFNDLIKSIKSYTVKDWIIVELEK